MEIIQLEKDIKVFYITAVSFPDGVLASHQQLHAMVPYTSSRRYFGISRPENGVVIYKAAAEELQPGEADQLHCDAMLIKKGKYISAVIPDFMNDIPAIARTFQHLLAQPGIDHQGYCVEEYFDGKDMRCMVRLAD